MGEFIQFMVLPLCACLIIIIVLGYLGIHVLQREIIFIDIALAQIAVLGSIIGLVLLHAEHNSILAHACAIGATVLAAGLYSVVQRKTVHISLETVIGITYALAAAAALFIIGLRAEGHVHVHHMLSGSLLWVQWKDLLCCGAVALATGLVFFVFRGKFQELSESHARREKRGKNTVMWDFLCYVLMGIVITFFVRIAGVLVVFSFLIIPAAISAMFSERAGIRWVIALAVGTPASVAGLLLSYHLDFSIGPSVVSFLGIGLVTAGIVKSLARWRLMLMKRHTEE